MARESKKLALLYSLSTRASGSCDKAKSICAGIAPGGTEVVKVFRHKSHITQRQGHSRLVKKTVATGRISPEADNSCSTKNKYGFCGSRVSRSGRRSRIHWSRSRLVAG